MRATILSSLPLALGFLLAACGTKPAPSVPVDPNLIVVDDKGVFLGGERLGPPPEDTIAKVEALFTKLTERREQWKAAHPSEKPTSALTLELGPAVTCQAVMSAFQTAGFAGYPDLTLKQGTTTLEVPCLLPSLPGGDKALAPDPGLDGFLTFEPENKAEFRPRRFGGAYDVVPVASVPTTVKEWCGGKGDCLGTLRVTCAAGIPMATILPALAEVRRGSAKMVLGTGGIGGRLPGEGPATDRGLELAASKKLVSGVEVSAAPRLEPPPPPGMKLPRGRLVPGAVTATGGITSDEVIDAMKAKFDAFNRCFGRGLLRNPNLQGSVVVHLDVGKRGAVMAVSDGGSDMLDIDVRECVLAAASAVSFTAKGAIGLVSYPLMMSPK
jgi:hypothetical protein